MEFTKTEKNKFFRWVGQLLTHYFSFKIVEKNIMNTYFKWNGMANFQTHMENCFFSAKFFCLKG
jgi:hypothetical protein